MAKRISNPLVALSSAAIASVYAVGYLHTQAAPHQAGGAEVSRSATMPRLSPTAQAAPPAVSAPTPSESTAASRRRITIVAPTATPLPSVSSRPVGATAPPPPNVAPAQALADGTYQGQGTSNFGNVDVAVQVQGGKVVAVDVSRCSTYYPCSWISHLPAQVVARQSADVDLVSGATGSAAAFQQAVSQALQAAAQRKLPATAAKAAASLYKDGTYVGEGSNRRADVQVTVVVKGGRIQSADITSCDTQYPCSLLDGLPAQVVARQSDNVDLITRATLSYSAFRDAVQQALAKARQGAQSA